MNGVAGADAELQGGELLDVAVDAARRAGALLAERFRGGREQAVATKSTPTDLVSEADYLSQQTIREVLTRRRPNDGFLGEEGGDEQGASGLRWIVDPLDGTINFLYGIPQWCVSVAVSDAGGAVAGAVFDPLRDELFTAVRGGPPECNGARIEPSGCDQMPLAMVATGFQYDAAVREAQGQVLTRMLGRVRDIRRFGSAALDLAWTAAGRFDAYFERGVNSWDVAAGALICRSAGLEVIELPIHPNLPWGVLTAAPGLAGELAALAGAPAEPATGAA